MILTSTLLITSCIVLGLIARDCVRERTEDGAISSKGWVCQVGYPDRKGIFVPSFETTGVDGPLSCPWMPTDQQIVASRRVQYSVNVTIHEGSRDHVVLRPSSWEQYTDLHVGQNIRLTYRIASITSGEELYSYGLEKVR